MRILGAVALLAVAGSVWLAKQCHDATWPFATGGRKGTLPLHRFVDLDPQSRARRGEAERALGVAMSGYEDLVTARPSDLDALRGRIRVGFMIASVGVGLPTVEAIVHAQVDAYLQHRTQIDPDGSFLRDLIERWIVGRFELDWRKPAAFDARTSAAIYLAARGDPSGHDALVEFSRGGPFHRVFFPFVRRYHPAWPGVEPLAVHYLEHGDLSARVEAGVTLLDYNALFGVGDELVDRFLPVIRASIREMRRQVRAFSDEGASEAGRAAILGMALLANRGDADEMRLLEAAKDERGVSVYAPFADAVRIARLCAGLGDFETMAPLTVRYKDLDLVDQDLYYTAVAHRATRLCRAGPEGAVAAKDLLDLLEAAFDGTIPAVRVYAMQVLLRLAPERGNALVARAIDAHSGISIYAGALADHVDDPAALFLPALGSPNADLGAVAAASLADRPLPRALQR